MEMQTRIQARRLRQKFERHPSPAKIAAAMSDADLVALYNNHEANRVRWQLEDIAKRNAEGRR
jgi:hypothetical protein